jgi:hypothetical protein
MSYNTYGYQQQVPQQTGYTPQGYQQEYNQPHHYQQPDVQQTQVTSTPSKYDQLSFLSTEDQSKFERLFNSVTDSISISPETARAILQKSNLSPHNLARIWELSDINKSGDLLFPEFALTLHLCNVVLRGSELPYQLDFNIKEEVSRQVDKINFNIPEDQPSTTTSSVPYGSVDDSAIFETNPVSGTNSQPPQQTNYFQPPQIGFHQPVLFASPQKQQAVFSAPLTNQPTGFGFQNSSLQPSVTSQLNHQQTGFSKLNQQPTAFASQQLMGFTSNENSATLSSQTPTQQSNLSSGVPLAQQPTGLIPLKTQSTGVPIQRQQTGLQSSGILQTQMTGPQPSVVNGFNRPLNQQLTGMGQLNQQLSGLVPMKTQQTGQALITQHIGVNNTTQVQQQHTGLVPLRDQQTGQIVTQQQTGLNQQNTASLQQQPTGLVSLINQQTGQPLKQQPTGLAPLITQQTGTQPLNVQRTGTTAPLQRQPTGLVPLNAQPTGQQPTNLIPISTGPSQLQQQPTGLVPVQAVPTGQFVPLKQQKTGYGQNSFFLTSLVSQSDSYANSYSYLTQARITSEEKKLFNKIFDNYDSEKKGLLNADICAEIFRKSGLNREDLEKVWDLVTRPNQTHLDKESFQMGMWLVYKRLNGAEIPTELPESLKPSSVKILDDVKNKLRVQDNVKPIKKSSNSKLDGSRFKNNDDELITSSSRHRRRTANTPGASKTANKSEQLSIDQLKKLIKEKRIILDALDVQGEESLNNEKEYEQADLLAIESLKEQLRNLPLPNSGSNLDQLQSKITELTSRVPHLITDISTLDNSITASKLELFKLKNPSMIVGTGPNGEITDGDRRRAKSKLLLAQKMAKLTGKPIDPEVEKLANDATSLGEEVMRIQQENSKNQQMIKDVESSIKEISSHLLGQFKKDTNDGEFKKWELGIGVHPEVQEIIKSFRVSEITGRVTRAPEPIQYQTPAVSSPVVPSSIESIPSSRIETPQTLNKRPSFATEEERKAYIKEQARKKMEERMAKLGIHRSRISASSPDTTLPNAKLSAIYIPPVHDSTRAPEDESSSDDDEEELRRMEEIRQLKREERDARLKGIRE